jgi:quercetin dioxygenase-like cupin family protein
MRRLRGPDEDEANRGPASEFTGVAWMDRLQEDPVTVRIGYVTFEARGRTNWHWHAGDQYLVVVSGRGAAVSRAGDVISLEPGVVVLVPAEEEHWHGATPDISLAHVALTAGKTCWRNRVSDQAYDDAVAERDASPGATT